jgi:hypothetical protein
MKTILLSRKIGHGPMERLTCHERHAYPPGSAPMEQTIHRLRKLGLAHPIVAESESGIGVGYGRRFCPARCLDLTKMPPSGSDAPELTGWTGPDRAAEGPGREDCG